MMVIVSILTLTADLAVNILVYPIPMASFCDFDHGLVMNGANGSDSFTSPPANSYPALLAVNAQIYSLDNECETGIFRKIPYGGNVTFCGSDYDVLGTWECSSFGEDYNFDAAATADYIADSLVNNSLQYDAWSSSEYTQNNNGFLEPSHVAIWSASNADETGSDWDVLVSVDLNGTYTQTKTMRTYQCKIHSYSSNAGDLDNINGVLRQMPGNTSLYNWAPGLEAALYMGDETDIDAYAALRIETRLNAMIMVQGGSNNILNPPLDSDYPWFGCIQQQTYVSSGVLALIGFAGMCFVIVTAYWLSLLFRLGTHALPSFLHGSEFTNSIKPVPDSILTWMLQASRENSLGSTMVHGESMYLAGIPKKERELHNWGFSVVDPGNHIARMVRTRGTVAPHVEQVYMHAEQK
jgi:hypothetical protein